MIFCGYKFTWGQVYVEGKALLLISSARALEIFYHKTSTISKICTVAEHWKGGGEGGGGFGGGLHGALLVGKTINEGCSVVVLSV